ncbi:hypothetical protein K438DRAFT_1632973, partial [Mycena galopus ATCC 62051]
SEAQFISTATGLDTPKVQPISASAFEWWYFDVVSTDPTSLASVVVMLLTAPHSAFPVVPASDSVTVVSIWATFPNGTLWTAAVDGTGATVAVEGDGSSGTWHGTGFSWTGTRSSGYRIVVDALQIGVTGTISFQPNAPGHYPCGPITEGQTLEVGPHIGWANAVPDAASVVKLNIGGTPLAFSGSGYHDMASFNPAFANWSDQPAAANVASWYWGHGRLGDYSIVWYDFLDRKGTETVSAYVSKDNKILTASCTLGSIIVRPTGQNSTYPPTTSTGNPSGFHIAIDLGAEGRLEADVTVLGVLIDANPIYNRFAGNISGSVIPLRGRRLTGLVGMALFEQLKFTE